MPTFEYTAPSISKEQEQEEWMALSEEEQRAILSGMHGAESYPIVESEEMTLKAETMVVEAINSIPLSEKEEYMEALDRAPNLVRQESPLLSFLRRDLFDVWSAARRLVKYWKVRKDCFGEERTFLPMTQLDDGAMQGNFVQDELEKAVCLVLAQPDQHDRPVAVLHRNRCRSDYINSKAAAQCLFYALQGLISDEVSTKQGFVLVVNVMGYDLRQAMHMFTGPGRSVIGIILPVVKQIAGKEIRMRMLLHSGFPTDVLPKLAEYGLDQDHIACVYDGNKNTLECQAWLTRRRLAEEEQARAAEQ